ncbi:MAG TPA: methyltransferase domain-containing protein [Candidatus Dormibacteraeota bacterium]|nr:methyltransferase domain-containing protein [Candidatus Dormibacteraeota bacterium]
MQISPEMRKQGIAHVFTLASPTYDSVVPFFAHFGRRIVDLAGIRPGDSVLDVAAGRGAVLLPAAAAAGPSGRVIGVDLAVGMVDSLRERIVDDGLGNADVRLMDAESLEFGDAEFDVVVCAFGIMFLPNAAEALHGFRRVVKPGGRVAIAVWAGGAPDFHLGELAVQFGMANLEGGPPPPWADEASFTAMLDAAGFRDSRVVTDEATFAYAGVDEWWRTQMSHGARAYVAFLAEDQRRPFEAAARQRYVEVTGSKGPSTFVQRALIALAGA